MLSAIKPAPLKMLGERLSIVERQSVGRLYDKPRHIGSRTQFESRKFGDNLVSRRSIKRLRAERFDELTLQHIRFAPRLSPIASMLDKSALQALARGGRQLRESVMTVAPVVMRSAGDFSRDKAAEKNVGRE